LDITAVATASEGRGQKRALIISISKYDKLDPLDFCEKDGNKMYDVLFKLGYTIQDQYKLIGGRIEYLELHDAIINFFQDGSIDSKDTVLFYFSGHGVLGDDGEHYLSTSEIDPDKPRQRGFPFDTLSKVREDCNSKTIFTILDCCYSGADRPGQKGGDATATAARNLIEVKSKSLGEGKCILTACKPTQKAYEYKKQGHSFFTFFLAKALTSRECIDSEGDVTPELVNRYIDNKIRSLTEDIRPKQTPLLDCRTAGKIILAHSSKSEIELSEGPLKGTEPYEDVTRTPKKHKKHDSILELIDKASALLEEGDYGNAIKIFDTILLMRPRHIDALNGKGMAFYKQKKYKKALECFQKVLKIKPRNPVAIDYLGMITDRISKARAGKAKPSRKDIKQDMAILQKHAEQKVIKALNESTQIPSELIKRGDQFYEKGNYQDAILCYDQALKIEPRSELAWYGKGIALDATGDYKEALSSFEEALKIDPSSQIYRNEIRREHEKMGQAEGSQNYGEYVPGAGFFWFSQEEPILNPIIRDSRKVLELKEYKLKDWQNCSVSAFATDSGKVRVNVRNKNIQYSRYMKRNIEIKFLYSFDISSIEPPVMEKYIQPNWERNDGGEFRWVIHLKKEGNQLRDRMDCSIWQWASQKDIKQSNIFNLFLDIQKKLKSSDPITNIDYVHTEGEANDKVIPVIVQPSFDGWKNFVRQVHCAKIHGSEYEFTVVFNDEYQRKHGTLESSYRFLRPLLYGRLPDLKSFRVIIEDNSASYFVFPGIYSGKSGITEDSVHGDREWFLRKAPRRSVKYHYSNRRHPIVFINTADHAMAEEDSNETLWKWEFMPWETDSPIVYGNKSRSDIEELVRNLDEAETVDKIVDYIRQEEITQEKLEVKVVRKQYVDQIRREYIINKSTAERWLDRAVARL